MENLSQNYKTSPAIWHLSPDEKSERGQLQPQLDRPVPDYQTSRDGRPVFELPGGWGGRLNPQLFFQPPSTL